MTNVCQNAFGLTDHYGIPFGAWN